MTPDLLSAFLAFLGGGLTASVSVTVAAHTLRGRAVLAATRGPRFAAAAVGLVVVGAASAIVLVRAFLVLGGSGATPAPEVLFALGLGLGLPLSLPGLFVVWRTERRKVHRRLRPATEEERTEFARQVARQIREATRPPRRVVVEATGEEMRILCMSGEVGAAEGDRLASALRQELTDLGFTRVEGRGPGGDWWAPV